MNAPFVSAVAIVLALMAGSEASSADPMRVIASYPSGTFLENLAESPDGTVLITSYFDRTLLRWTGQGAPETFSNLESHPVAVIVRNDNIVLSVHGRSFAEGPAFTQTNAFVILGRDGAVRRTIPATDALFLNGIIEIAPGIVLAADSLAGKIWQLDLETGDLRVWLADPLFAVNPDAGDQRPGANGLKRHDDGLYVSNSSRQALYRIALRGTEPAGPPELVANTGPIDDFAFLADGSIVAASHGDTVFRVDVQGMITTLLSEGCDGCTSVLPFGSQAEVIVLTTGRLLDGGTEPARIIAIPSPISN